MDAHELRIGNIVGLKDGSWFVVTEDHFKTLEFWESFHGSYQGVPINEYWASSLGLQVKLSSFITYIEDNQGQSNEFNLLNSVDENDREIWIVQYNEHTLKRVEYVHQIQNLFFAIGDYELTLAL
nr:hypothetical protein [Pedobacter panaciterrae]